MDRKYYSIIAYYAQETKRYEDMWEATKELSALSELNDFTDDEKHLFQTSFKSVISAKRAAYKVIRSTEKYSFSLIVDGIKPDIVRRYRIELEKEVRDMCKQMLNLINDTLSPKASQMESKIFYMHLRGDCYRYLAEVNEDKNERKELALKASQQYLSGIHEANSFFNPIHPLRLGLANNYGVLLNDIIEDNDKACGVMEAAVESAKVYESSSLSARDLIFSKDTIKNMRECIDRWKNPSPKQITSSEESEKEDKSQGTSSAFKFQRLHPRKSCD